MANTNSIDHQSRGCEKDAAFDKIQTHNNIGITQHHTNQHEQRQVATQERDKRNETQNKTQTKPTKAINKQ